MSLLLDALKKAADDKQKALQAKDVDDSNAPVGAATEKSVAEKPVEADVSPEFQNIKSDDVEDDDLTLELQGLDDAVDELSLDIEPLTDDDASAAQSDPTDTYDDEDIEIWESPQQVPEKTPGSQESMLGRSKSGWNNKPAENDNYVISDEALAMLIYKTNREIKKGNRLTIISVFLITIMVLIAGGFYYYTDTQSTIDDIERKHKIAVQQMKSKTNLERKPDNAEVIRNLVDDKTLADKVEQSKVVADKKFKKPIKEKTIDHSTSSPQQKNTANTKLSIKKLNKVDIVAEKLDAAWFAYESANYAEAKQLYQDVLVLEARNRDAILGLGAIAITENDATKASDYYMSLLQQDPLDPIANAALTNMNSDEDLLKSHEDHLLSMLQKNPEAAPLHYALGNVYAKQQNWKSAQQAYFDAWQNDNDNADYVFNLAVSLDQMDKKQQALSFYKKSLQKSKYGQAGFSREAVKKRINELSES